MKQLLNQSLIIFSIIIAGGLVYLLAPILTPFLLSALLAYLANPLVKKLEKWHFSHLLSVIFVFFFIFLILTLGILLLVPLIEKQIVALITALPGMIAWVQETIIPWLRSYFDIGELIDVKTLQATLSATGPKVAWVLKTVVSSGMTVMGWLINLILVPVVTFYLLRDWDRILASIRHLLPRFIEPTIVKIMRDCDEVLSAFFRGQLLVMLGLGLIYSIGLSLIGLKLGLVIGFIIGILSIVPYLGLIVGLIIASITVLMQFGMGVSLLLMGLVFLVGQCSESFILTPLLVGHRIGLHPVAVIFSVLAGGTLFGFFGVLLGLPVAAVIMVWIRFLNKRYQASALYQ